MISIIIPVLNEAEHIVKLLDYLYANSQKASAIEVIVVDGGSQDNTPILVSNFGKKYPKLDLKLIYSDKGRAKQMNAGAKIATHDIFYFLHADSYPPANYDAHISREIHKGNQAGCFKMRFDNNHWWLRLASWLTKFNWRACRGGDQSQFITRALFTEIGGYDERYIIYEDNILLNELYARNEFVVIQHWLKSSARLYEERGIWYVQYHFWTIYVKKWLGADADELLAYYNKHIKLKKKETPTCEASKKILAQNQPNS